MKGRMNALVKTEPGEGNLELKEVQIPEIGSEDVLLEVAYCGICGSDLHIEAGTHPCEPPVTIGHEFSGIVAEVGADVSEFAPGDEVGFRRSWNPFPGVAGDGAFAEYMRAPADAIWHLPQNISLQEATQFETIRVPMTLVRDVAEMDAGERVVVSGPGTIGLLVANVAAMYGAGSVVMLGTEDDTAVRLPQAARMGADETLVFGEDALRTIKENPPSVWFEASGAPPAIKAAVDHVARNGRVVCSGLGDGPWNVNMQRVAYENLQILGQWGGENKYVEPAAKAMRTGEIAIGDIITDVVALTEWRDGFDRARTQSGIKILIDPSQ